MQLCNHLKPILKLSMNQHIPNISPQQNFKKFIIQSPIGTQILNDTTYQNAEKTAINYLQKIVNSSYYKAAEMHYGVKFQYSPPKAKQAKQNNMDFLNYRIELENETIQNIAKAKTEQQLEKLQQKYEKSVNYLNDLQEQSYRKDYVPCIHISAQKKIPIYGQFIQDFNSKGMGMLTAKFGYRSVFDHFDKIQLNFQSPLMNLKRKYYHFGMTWQNQNDKYGNIYCGVNYGNSNLYRHIDQKAKTVSAGFAIDDNKIQISRSSRIPYLYDEVVNYINHGFHIPSKKYSIKINKLIKNTLKYGDITTGEYSELNSEITIPFLSDAKFFKLQYSYRKFFDIFSTSKYFQSKLIKKLIQNSSVQANFSSSLTTDTKNYVSDLLETIDIRGFENQKLPTVAYSNFKASVKYNVYNFPILKLAKILTFLYAQAGVSFEKHHQKKFSPYRLGSMGFGFSYAFNQSAQLEILYTLLQYQSGKKRQPVNFQIRVGIFD